MSRWKLYRQIDGAFFYERTIDLKLPFATHEGIIDAISTLGTNDFYAEQVSTTEFNIYLKSGFQLYNAELLCML